MGVLSNSAIIVLLVCIGENGIGAESEVDGWKEVNIQKFKDLNEVIQQALPKIKQKLNLSSIEVLDWTKALHQKLLEGRTKWQIMIKTNQTYGEKTEEKKHGFQAVTKPARECPNDKVVCIKSFLYLSSIIRGFTLGNSEKCDALRGFKYVDKQRFKVLSQVIQQAVPKIKQHLKLSSIEVLDWKNAKIMKVSNSRDFKWAITIDTNDTNGNLTQKQRHFFEVEQEPANWCLRRGLVCIKNFLLVDPENNTNGAESEVDDWKQVNIPLYRDLYEIIHQAVPMIEQEVNLSSVKVLNWRNAQLKNMLGGTNWKITIDTKDTNGNSVKKQQHTFEVEQQLAGKCQNNKVVCVKNFFLHDNDTVMDDELDYWQPVPSFDHLRALYQANNKLMHNTRVLWNDDDDALRLDGFVYAKYQQVANGINWKIESAIQTWYLQNDDCMFKGKVGVPFDLFQPKQCEEGPVCFEGIKATDKTYDIETPLCNTLSRRWEA